MSPKKKAKSKIEVGTRLCMNCFYVTNPRSLSLKGVPTLATCPFSEFAVLYQRDCENGHFKAK